MDGGPACARVDLAALTHNLAAARRAAPAVRIMAVVKANAYGHGLVPVAQALRAADGFAVAHLAEALALAEALPQPVTVLQGCECGADWQAAAAARLLPVIHHGEQLRMLAHTRLAQPLSVWIKLDTGMHRLGFDPAELPAALARLEALAPRVAIAGFLTHLACADEPDHPHTAAQLAAFRAALGARPGARSSANSAALLAVPDSHMDWVRPGLMLYGVSPFPGRSAASLGLVPAMTLESHLIAVRRVAAGESVGYGASFRCPEDMPVGVAAVGYADGYPREVCAGAPVLLRGRRVPLIGRVSMDLVTLDLRTVPNAAVGDPVRLWGEGLPIEEIATAAGTIPYTLLCGVAQRVRLHYHTPALAAAAGA